jgi:hypothetical protein
MKWIGNRISYVDQENKSTIIITPENVGFVKALIGAWFFMWIAIGAVISWSFFTFQLKEQEKIALVVFMVFWTYYFVRIGRMFLWLLYGSENLKIDKIALTLKTAIKKYGKSKEYYIENIEKIRMFVPEKKSFQAAWENSPWIRGGERLEFDYRGKTIRFGRKLTEQEAKQLFQLITKRLDDQLKKKKKTN